MAGGIDNFGPGTLSLSQSAVTGNRAVVAAPNGQFAEAGGIENSAIATIDHSVVSANRLDATGVGGEVLSFGGGIDDDGSLTLTNSTVEHNHLTALAPAGIGGFVLADAGGIEIDGTATIADTTISANDVAAHAPDGTVVAAGGGLLAASFGGVTIQRSLITRNSITADSANGSAFAQGGGIANFGLMTLEQTRVIANSGSANGPTGAVQGGGIWNSNFQGGPPTTPQLNLTDTDITANNLGSSPAGTPQGGGLYTTFPVTRTRTVIAGNKPDQCFGC